MTRLRISIAILAAAVVVLEGNQLWAQQGGVGVSSNRGQAGSSAALSETQGYGLSNRFGGSNFGLYTRGSSEMGTTTAGAHAGTSGFGQDATGSTRGTATNFGRMGTLGSFGLGALGGLRGLGGYNGIFGLGRGASAQTQQSAQHSRVIRTRTKLGFAQPTPTAASVVASYNKVIKRVLERDDYGSGTVNIKMEGEVAVLTGTVESSHDRDIAERLALLEPGIAAVRNELTLRAAEPKPET